MKIGTISLNINAPDFNYGAVLHSWAFQQYLKKLDCVDSVEIIDYTTPKLEGQNLKHPIITSLKQRHLKKACKYIAHYSAYMRRYRKFNSFIVNNLCVSKVRYDKKALNAAVLDYDCIICESDVIWSQAFFGGNYDESFFLALESMQKMKRIAYAPSMGDGDVNREQGERLRQLLQYPQYISCRELYEKTILEKYTEKSVTHVLDPVLLLEKEDYHKICADRIENEPYLLLYLPVDDNSKLRSSASEYAKRNKLKIIEISTYLKETRGNNEVCYGSAGIEEFLSLIKYASVVFTNSFHAICFSILFEVQFYAFSRSCAGKVKDICDVFGLQDRYFEDDNFAERSSINYSELNKKRRNLVIQSQDWLVNALKK